MSNWITDRLPTEDDAPEDWVFVMNHGNVVLYLAVSVELGMPWHPIVPPAPYVKPKRWAFRKSRFECYDNWLVFRDGELIHSLAAGLTHDAAQRICDIYNEEMP
jgi:hypothetical protein